MRACAAFRAELESAWVGPPDALAALARHVHARQCPGCRAELARERAFEALLARVPAPEVPPALARRLLAHLERERGPSPHEYDELDELLARLPAPRVPAGLARRVLHGTAPARRPRPRRLARRRLVLIAAALLVALAWWGWSLRRPSAVRLDVATGPGALEGDEELLAYAVERWELLQDQDLDLWLACLDPVDELLLEYADDLAGLVDGPPEGAGRVGD